MIVLDTLVHKSQHCSADAVVKLSGFKEPIARSQREIATGQLSIAFEDFEAADTIIATEIKRAHLGIFGKMQPRESPREITRFDGVRATSRGGLFTSQSECVTDTDPTNLTSLS